MTEIKRTPDRGSESSENGAGDLILREINDPLEATKVGIDEVLNKIQNGDTLLSDPELKTLIRHCLGNIDKIRPKLDPIIKGPFKEISGGPGTEVYWIVDGKRVDKDPNKMNQKIPLIPSASTKED